MDYVGHILIIGRLIVIDVDLLNFVIGFDEASECVSSLFDFFMIACPVIDGKLECDSVGCDHYY
jgi:hypothetical protein